MQLRRIPPAVLAALGLSSAVGSCDCPLGPCLEPAPVDDAKPDPPRRADPDVNACLTAIPPKDTPPDPKVGHCLSPPQPDPKLTPCLSPPQPDPKLTPCLSPPKPDPDVGPCLEPPPVDPPLHPCLSRPPDKPKGGGKGKPPAHESHAHADVVRRVLERGPLPDDVVARLVERTRAHS